MSSLTFFIDGSGERKFNANAKQKQYGKNEIIVTATIVDKLKAIKGDSAKSDQSTSCSAKSSGSSSSGASARDDMEDLFSKIA